MDPLDSRNFRRLALRRLTMVDFPTPPSIDATEGRPFTSARQPGWRRRLFHLSKRDDQIPPSGVKRGRGGDAAVNGIRRMRERCEEIALLHLAGREAVWAWGRGEGDEWAWMCAWGCA